MNQKWINIASGKLNKERLPCQTVILDFYIQYPKDKLSRIAIEERDEQFHVIQWQVKMVGKETDLVKKVQLVTEHEWEAKEKIEELSTCLELEQWLCINEETFTVYDVDKAFDKHFGTYCECISVSEYLMRRGAGGHCKIRQIPKGFFCVMTIDPVGTVRLKTRGCRDIVAPASIGVVYDPVFRLPGTKGFAAEGVFDGTRFYMTDVLYVGSDWVNHQDFEQREGLWLAYVSKNNLGNSHMLKQHDVKKSAISALLNDKVCSLMVYDEKGRVAIGEYAPKQVNVGGEKNKILYDDSFKKLGVIREPGGLDLAYKTFECLHLNTGNLGLEGVFF